MTELSELRRLADAAERVRAGPWEAQDGCSFRRIGRKFGVDGDVVRGTNLKDGHPDITAPPGVLAYIAAASPDVVLKLIDDRERLREALTDARAGWRYIRRHYGDLSGVGWDRVESSATAALGPDAAP